MTAGLCLCGVLWALLAPGRWFLLSFGLMGAGEFFDAYFRNYVICCSPRSKMRRNVAFLSMIGLPIGFAPYLFGRIADEVGAVYSEKVGFQAAFAVALSLLAVGLVVMFCLMPRNPRPRERDMDDLDLAARSTANGQSH